MAAEWYYTEDGQQQGPVELDQLLELVKSGKVKPDDSAWKDGMSDWALIPAIPDLAQGVPAEDGPPPVPASGPPQREASTKPFEMPAQLAGIADSPILPLAVAAGAGLCILAFMMPWWSISQAVRPGTGMDPSDYADLEADERSELKEEQDDYDDKHKDDMKDYRKLAGKSWYEDWIEDREVDEAMKDEYDDADEKTKRIGVWLWGPSFATAWIAFFFGLIILPLAVVPMFVKPIKEWAWTGAFLSVVLALVVFIMSMVAMFTMPGENFGDFVKQGRLLGPFMVLFGSMAILGGSIAIGVFGLLAFIKKLTAK